MEKVLQELFGHIYLGAHAVQTVPKYIWMQHWEVLVGNLERQYNTI